MGWLISIGEEGGISGLATPADQYQVSGMNIFASILSVFFITIILYSLVRMYEIRRNEKEIASRRLILIMLERRKNNLPASPYLLLY